LYGGQAIWALVTAGVFMLLGAWSVMRVNDVDGEAAIST